MTAFALVAVGVIVGLVVLFFFPVRNRMPPRPPQAAGAGPAPAGAPGTGAPASSATTPAPAGDPTGGLGVPPPGPAPQLQDDAPAFPWNPESLAAMIVTTCVELDYPRHVLARAIAWRESSMSAGAINPTDNGPSLGLFQMKLWLAKHYNPDIECDRDLLEPVKATVAAVRHLQELESKWLTEYGLDGVIQMWPLGETKFRQGQRHPAYLEAVRAWMARLG